jgi:hypothetical protein
VKPDKHRAIVNAHSPDINSPYVIGIAKHGDGFQAAAFLKCG